MIIKIHNTDYSNRTRLLERYPALSKFGYHDEELESIGFAEGYVGKVVINSPEDFITLSKDLNQEIIVSAEYNLEPSVEIYDGWRE